MKVGTHSQIQQNWDVLYENMRQY